MSREMKLRLRSIATVLVILAMVFAFAISGVRLFGLQVYGVLTGSMEPSYPTGSLVYVKAVDPATLKVSDVITFSMGRNIVATHRIVEKVPDSDNPYSYSFRTKGDANDSVDNGLVSQSNIIGKVVFSVPMMGYIASYIQNPPGTYIAILISLLLIAFVFITDNVDAQPTKRRRKKRAFLSPADRRQVDTLISKYLPFLRKKKQPKQDNYLRQGYSPSQQRPPFQYRESVERRSQYPSSQQQPQHFPQTQHPRQQSQTQGRYPSQQYPQYHQPQQRYQPYPQQREQYSSRQTPQQPRYQYDPQGQYPTQQCPQQQRSSQQYPQNQQPRQQQYAPQYDDRQQPSQRYPRQNPYEQQSYRQDWPQQSQPRRTQGQHGYPEDYQ